jgi:hypothetical protein
MDARNDGFPGLARSLPGLARRLPAGRADQHLSKAAAARRFARLRARFPGWHMTRTATGTYRARHRSSGARLYGRTVADLEGQLLERLARRALARDTGLDQVSRRRRRHPPRQPGSE